MAKEETKIVEAPVGEETKIVEAPVKEMVSISKETLDDLMKRLDRVESAASKAALAKFDEKNKEKIGETSKLRVWEGKVVTSWDKMIENNVEKTPEGKWFETQMVKINFEDETSKTLIYVDWIRHYEFIVLTVLDKVKSSSTGKTIYKLVSDEGKEYNISEEFVN